VKLNFFEDHIRVDLEKKDFLEIADEFIKENKTQYKNFCGGNYGKNRST